VAFRIIAHFGLEGGEVAVRFAKETGGELGGRKREMKGEMKRR
jgi:hypothetical protein